jgi:CheY-like chemotaxis protein
MRDLFQDVLSQMHYEVIPAGSGQEALDIYTRQKDDIDWVILDSASQSATPLSALHRMVNINPQVKLIVTHPGAPASGERMLDLPHAAEANIRHLHVPQGFENLSRSLERVLEQGCC